MDELIEVILVACTQVDEGLDSLIRIRGYLLSLTCFNCFDNVIHEHGKVGDAVVYVRRLVHPNKGLVKDGEEISEKLQCGRLRWF